MYSITRGMKRAYPIFGTSTTIIQTLGSPSLRENGEKRMNRMMVIRNFCGFPDRLTHQETFDNYHPMLGISKFTERPRKLMQEFVTQTQTI